MKNMLKVKKTPQKNQARIGIDKFGANILCDRRTKGAGADFVVLGVDNGDGDLETDRDFERL
eukprot:m.178279 g.178279  ORF g.178279 m.178279 type:complete len:62 (+) comp31933_c3_seq12:87-272(+)